MRRNAIGLTASLLALSLGACAEKQAKMDPFQGLPSDPYNAPSAAPSQAFTQDAFPTAGTTLSMDNPYEPERLAPLPMDVGGTRFHMVARHDTLFALARRYYAGDASRWKDIYEANRTKISDPNQIRVGQKLMIP